MASSKDRVWDTTTSTTSPFTVSGTPPDTYKTFSAVYSVNDTFEVAIVSRTLNEWEVCEATYSASNQVTVGRILASSNSDAAVTFSAGTKDITVIVAARNARGREVLNAARNYYCRADLGRLSSLTIATPAVATTSSVHGLSVNDPVVFSFKRDKAKGTVTIASPGVWTRTAHVFVANDQVTLSTTGALPTGYTAGTTYFVRNPATNTFELSATSGGASINTSGTQSGIHFVERVATFPTGVAEGTVYYVTAVPTTTTFRFSTSLGGSDVATSGTTTGYLSVATGNDSNSGLAQTRAGAMLTPQGVANRVYGEIDFSGQNVTMVFADSTYVTGVLENGPWTGGGSLYLVGDINYPANCYFNIPGASCFSFSHAGTIVGYGFKLACGAGSALFLSNGIKFQITSSVEWGATPNYQIEASFGANVVGSYIDGFIFSGNATAMFWSYDGGHIDFGSATIYFISGLTYTFTVGALNPGAKIGLSTTTWYGTPTAARYVITLGAAIDTGSGGNTSIIPGTSSGSGGTTTGGGFYA